MPPGGAGGGGACRCRWRWVFRDLCFALSFGAVFFQTFRSLSSALASQREDFFFVLVIAVRVCEDSSSPRTAKEKGGEGGEGR